MIYQNSLSLKQNVFQILVTWPTNEYKDLVSSATVLNFTGKFQEDRSNNSQFMNKYLIWSWHKCSRSKINTLPELGRLPHCAKFEDVWSNGSWIMVWTRSHMGISRNIYTCQYDKQIGKQWNKKNVLSYMLSSSAPVFWDNHWI